MASVVIAVAASAAGYGAAYAVGGGIAGAIVGGIASAAVSAVGSALLGGGSPKPETPSFQRQASDRKQSIRSSVKSREVVYGQVRVSGPMAFAHSTGGGKEYLHIVIPVAHGEVTEIGDVYFQNTLITDSRFNGHVRVNKHLGASDQAADSDLVSEADPWTTDHRLRGIAYIYARLTWSAKVYPNGLQSLSAVVKGKAVWDPRDVGQDKDDPSTWAWSDNPALCILDYLRNKDFGLGYDMDKLDEASFIAAANICDEDVVIDAGGTTQKRYRLNGTVDTEQDPPEIMAEMRKSCAGMLVFSQGKYKLLAGAYTTPTRTLTDDNLAGSIKVMPRFRRRELFNRVRGTYVDPSKSWEPTDFPPVENHSYEVEDSERQTTFTVDAATDTFTPADGLNVVTGEPVEVLSTATLPTPLVSGTVYYTVAGGGLAASLSDAEAGTTIDITDAGTGTHKMVFGNRVTKDLELQFTSDPLMAQRLAKIHLEKSRQSATIEYQANMSALGIAPGDTVMLNSDTFGFSSKVFVVLTWKYVPKRPGFDLVMQEEAAAVYDWNYGEATTYDPAPNTDMAPALSAVAPTGLTLESGSTTLDILADGTIVPRIRVTWTAPADIYVTDGGRVEAHFKKSSSGTWTPWDAVAGDETETYIDGVVAGTAYDVRVRSVNSINIASDWVEATGHTVVGKEARPSDVTGLSVTVNAGSITAQWNQIPDLDRAGYDLRYMPKGQVYDHDSARELTLTQKGTLITTQALPPGDWTVGIKAVDTSKNDSQNAATADVTVEAVNTIIDSVALPDWSSATLTDCVHHQVSDVIVPKGTKTVDQYSTWSEIEGAFIPDPVSVAYVEAPVLDGGFDSSDMRAWAKILAALGPEELGPAKVTPQIRSKKDGGTWTAWSDWAVGTVPEARYVQMRAAITTATGVPYLSAFEPTLDEEETTLREQGVSIPSGGVTYVFSKQFHKKPGVSVSPQGAARIPVVTNVTTTSADISLVDTGNTDLGGTADITVTGV